MKKFVIGLLMSCLLLAAVPTVSEASVVCCSNTNCVFCQQYGDGSGLGYCDLTYGWGACGCSFWYYWDENIGYGCADYGRCYFPCPSPPEEDLLMAMDGTTPTERECFSAFRPRRADTKPAVGVISGRLLKAGAEPTVIVAGL